MSQKGSGLARLMGGLKSLDASADALATRLESAMGTLQTEMATTAQIVGNVETSVDDLRSINAQYSNGGAERKPGRGATDGGRPGFRFAQSGLLADLGQSSRSLWLIDQVLGKSGLGRGRKIFARSENYRL